MTWPKVRGLNQNPTAASEKHGWPVRVVSRRFRARRERSIGTYNYQSHPRNPEFESTAYDKFVSRCRFLPATSRCWAVSCVRNNPLGCAY